MKKPFLIILFLFTISFSSPTYSLDTLCKLTGVTCSKVNYENLISKNGFYYEKFKNEKYLGYVFGIKSGFVKNGKEDGTWEIYYKSGKLQKKVNYKNGVMEGISEEYNKNGNILSKSTYKNGLKHGVYNEYKSDGQLRFWTEYKDGKRDGEYEEFKNDILTVKGNYRNDEKEGEWSYIDKHGKNNKKIWVSGKLKSGLFTSIRGTGGQKKNFKREGYWKERHYSGISEGHYENDERVGFWKVIESSRIYSEGEYIDGYKQGIWKIYYISTNVMLNQENYKNNKLDGKRLSYFRNGKIKRIVNYRNGSKDGDYEIFTDYGVKCESGTYKNNVKKIEFSLSSSFNGVNFKVPCY